MTPTDNRHWWAAFGTFVEQRIEAVFANRHLVGRVYDPATGSGGDGWPCLKCRRVMRSDVRVCGSCGTLR